MDEIKMTAEPAPTGRACKFVVDRPVCDGAAYFPNAEAARHSPLAERIFKFETVTGVLLSGNTVTVNAGPFDDWRPIARQIAMQIREHLGSGAPAVDEEYRKSVSGREADLRARVAEVLDGQINPAIAAHGGVIHLIDVKGNTVYLQMSGGCQGCASSTATLRLGVESAIREAVPEVGEILDVTDHAAGANPYYASH